jgi:Tfp pilus assembly protein PilP
MSQDKNPEPLKKEALYLQCDYQVNQQLDPNYFVKITQRLKGSPKTKRGILAGAERAKKEILKSFEGTSFNRPINYCIIKIIEIL